MLYKAVLHTHLHMHNKKCTCYITGTRRARDTEMYKVTLQNQHDTAEKMTKLATANP